MSLSCVKERRKETLGIRTLTFFYFVILGDDSIVFLVWFNEFSFEQKIIYLVNTVLYHIKHHKYHANIMYTVYYVLNINFNYVFTH